MIGRIFKQPALAGWDCIAQIQENRCDRCVFHHAFANKSGIFAYSALSFR